MQDCRSFGTAVAATIKLRNLVICESYDSTGAPNVGTRYHHNMVAGDAATKLGSIQHNIFFNSVYYYLLKFLIPAILQITQQEQY